MKRIRKLYLYDTNNELVRTFRSTMECGEFFGYDIPYIHHNLKYCKKIWNKQEHKWYRISKELPIGKQQDY